MWYQITTYTETRTTFFPFHCMLSIVHRMMSTYIVSCFLIKCFWWRSGRERLSRALADIPLAVVLLGLTRSLSNANIVANTAYQKHYHKYCFNCWMFPSWLSPKEGFRNLRRQKCKKTEINIDHQGILTTNITFSRGKVIKSSSSSCFRYVAVQVRMEDIEEVVTHHEVTCLFLLHPRNIPHCFLQKVINNCHLEAQLVK